MKISKNLQYTFFPNRAAILISIVLGIMGCPGEKCIHVVGKDFVDKFSKRIR